jgi:hypothetical protein
MTLLITDTLTDRNNITFNQYIETSMRVFCSHDEIQHHYDFLVICRSFRKYLIVYDMEQDFLCI